MLTRTLSPFRDPGKYQRPLAMGQNNHLFAPLMEDARKMSNLPRYFHRELVRVWAVKSLTVISQLRPSLGLPSGPEVTSRLEGMLRHPNAVSLLPYEDDNGCHSWKDRLPTLAPAEPAVSADFCYKYIRHLVINTDPRLMRKIAEEVGLMPLSGSAGPAVRQNLELIEAQLRWERVAYLNVEWHKLERLESLFLDLRSYSCPHTDCLGVDDVLRLAYSLAGKKLKLLVITGLRSYALHPGVKPLSISDVEKRRNHGTAEQPVWAGDSLDSVNWFLMFSDAVRPGGTLILVDRQCDELCLPVWG